MNKQEEGYILALGFSLKSLGSTTWSLLAGRTWWSKAAQLTVARKQKREKLVLGVIATFTPPVTSCHEATS
jgi:hypothetical protein